MKKCLFFLLVFMSICGCGRKNTVLPTYRAVTQIDIVTKKDGDVLQWHYTSPEKMQYVLTFLRLLKPIGKPDINPETLTRDMFLIVLTRSDGTKVYYRQTGHRYFSKDDQNWFSISAEQAAGLYAILAQLPSDQGEFLLKKAKNTSGFFAFFLQV